MPVKHWFYFIFHDCGGIAHSHYIHNFHFMEQHRSQYKQSIIESALKQALSPEALTAELMLIQQQSDLISEISKAQRMPKSTLLSTEVSDLSF